MKEPEAPADRRLHPCSEDQPPFCDCLFPETFSVLACHKCSGHEKGNIVLLAVSNGELCLCCEIDKKKGQPSLQLKVSPPIQFPVPSGTLKGKARTCNTSPSPQILTLACTAGAPPPESSG